MSKVFAILFIVMFLASFKNINKTSALRQGFFNIPIYIPQVAIPGEAKGVARIAKKERTKLPSSTSRVDYYREVYKERDAKKVAISSQVQSQVQLPQAVQQSFLEPISKKPKAKIAISSFAYSASDFNHESITLQNTGDESVNVSGWTVKGLKEEITIPRAVRVYLSDYRSDFPEDIVLAPGEWVKVFTGKSPVGVGFKTNKCFGWIVNQYQFPEVPPASCSWPQFSELKILSSGCKDFFLSLPRCKAPNLDQFGSEIIYDDQCRDFLREKLSFQRCLQDNQKDPNFVAPGWWAYLGFQRKIWDPRHDWIRLLDRDGILVTEYSY